MTTSVTSSSRFSLKRVFAFAGYYMPRLRWQLVIYAAASLFGALLCLIPASATIQVGLLVLVSSMIPLLNNCSALIFAKGADSRIIDRLIPVSSAEKLTFFYVYLLILIPVSLYLFPYTANRIYLAAPSLQTPAGIELNELKFRTGGMLPWLNIETALLVTMVCFYVVMYARHNRLLWGIVAVIAANAFSGLIGAIIGGMAAFQVGFMDGWEGKAPDAEKISDQVITELSSDAWYVVCGVTVLAIAIIIVGILTYRMLRNRNL